MRKHQPFGTANRWYFSFVAALVLGGCGPSHDDVTPVMWAQKTIGWVGSAATLNAYALDYENKPDALDDVFCGYKILGKTVEIKSERRQRLLIAMQEGLEESAALGYPVYLALPSVTVGVRATARDGTIIDVVFNLETGASDVVLDDGTSHQFPMGKTPQDVLDEILADANIDQEMVQNS